MSHDRTARKWDLLTKSTGSRRVRAAVASLSWLMVWAAASATQAAGPLPVKAVVDVARTPPAPQFVPDEIIVKMASTRGGPMVLPASALDALGLAEPLGETSGGELIYELPPLTRGESAGPSGRERLLAAVKSLGERADVEYAQPNWIWQHFATMPNDPGYAAQWHYFARGTGAGETPGGANLPPAWDRGTGSETVTVAVIDTGILPNHPDIGGSSNLGSGYDMVSLEFIANDGDGRDADPTDPGDAIDAGECYPGSPEMPDSWHGTHVAGTVGVVKSNNGEGVAGVNWRVKVVPVRVLGKCGGTTSDINDAIRWAAGLSVPGVPANPNPAKVINLSLGGAGACSDSPSTQRAVDDAVAEGVTVVVAAGNEADDASGYSPASCDGVITVAASDYRGHLVERYSNYGDTVEILAPGGDVRRDDNADGTKDGVLSTIQGGYGLYNGTSMAAPHVAGVAALLLAREPGLSPQQVLQRLQDAAAPRSISQCPRPCGAGLLNADLSAPGGPPPTPVVTLEVSPGSIDVGEGKSATVTAIVKRGGAPVGGVSVTFASRDSGVATVTPASVVTDGAGRANATVTGVAGGQTVCVDASAEGRSECIRVTVPKAFPGLGPLTLAALVTLLLVWPGIRRAGAARV